MEFDIKKNLLKTTMGDNRFGQKNVKASIDESLVSAKAQKNLQMGIEKEKTNKATKGKEEKEKNKKIDPESINWK